MLSSPAAAELELIFLNVDSLSSTPQLLHSVKVLSDMTFSAFSLGCPISVKRLSSCMRCPAKINSFADFLNLLAFLNCSGEDSFPLRQILQLMDNCLEFENGLDDVILRRVSFWREQIHLSECTPSNRRFSSETLVSFLLFHCSNAAAYRTVMSDNLLIMPSERHLRRLS